MEPDRSDESVNLLFLTGIYSRVARQLGVHPSYVSRVARGERRSDRVYRAIAAELAKLRGASLPELQHDDELKASKVTAAKELRERLALAMTNDARLRRLSAVIIDDDAKSTHTRQSVPKQVSPASLSARLAANCRLISYSIHLLERLSKRLERCPHVLSVLDPAGIVLFSTGTTGMARREHRIPGTDWSKDFRGLSSGARAISAGVPFAIIGAFDLQGTFVPSVRMACPVRLSDNTVAGVLVVTIEVTRARAEHLIELTKIARRVCKFIENGPMEKSARRGGASKLQPFADAARNVAMVLTLPQVDSALRVALSGLLADLERDSRAALEPQAKKRRGHAQAAQSHS